MLYRGIEFLIFRLPSGDKSSPSETDKISISLRKTPGSLGS